MLGRVEARKLEELPVWATELLANAPVARLGFLDQDDRPRVLPVTFALHGSALWSAVDRKPKRPGEPARVRYLRRRPEAALTVDRYSDDWSELAWVQVLGRIDLRAVGQSAAALAALAAKYQLYLREPPQGPLLRLLPDRILCWRATDTAL
jgi:PPOX class probable F420-dependent enzyme